MSRSKLPLRDRLEILFLWKTSAKKPRGAIRWAAERYGANERLLYRHAGTVGRDGPPFTYPEFTATEIVQAGLALEERILEDERTLRATGDYDKFRKRQVRAKESGAS